MDPAQEHEIARGLREGRPEAWRALYDAYARPIWQAVVRALGPRATDVADVVQETFLAAARSARHYDPARGTLWLWICGIARNQVALHYRRARRHERLQPVAARPSDAARQVARWLEDRAQGPADSLADAELAGLVRDTLTELPADYEILLTTRYLDGASVEQIAGRENSRAAAIRSKLARARQAFRVAFRRSATGLSEVKG
jgi:RNA polymerase sigma-70 factor (ECF subfamily)